MVLNNYDRFQQEVDNQLSESGNLVQRDFVAVENINFTSCSISDQKAGTIMGDHMNNRSHQQITIRDRPTNNGLLGVTNF